MIQSRDSQVSLSDTPYYHCISRCVRRAFLCGDDKYTGKTFDHRRQWVVERMHFLASFFNIDICAYAVMSNHYHLVLHVNESGNKALTDKAVCIHWFQLYCAASLIDKWLKESKVTEAELVVIGENVRLIFLG